MANVKAYREEVSVNLKKANTLLVGIMKMCDEGVYCIDIMQQVMAVIGLLKSANSKLMEGHLNSCFKNAILSRNAVKQKTMIEEILRVTKLSNK